MVDLYCKSYVASVDNFNILSVIHSLFVKNGPLDAKICVYAPALCEFLLLFAARIQVCPKFL